MKDAKWFDEQEERIPKGEVRTRFAPSPTMIRMSSYLRPSEAAYLRDTALLLSA